MNYQEKYKELERLCREYVSNTLDSTQEFVGLLPYTNILGFGSFRQGLTVDNMDFEIYLKKYPFMNPRVKVKTNKLK